MPAQRVQDRVAQRRCEGRVDHQADRRFLRRFADPKTNLPADPFAPARRVKRRGQNPPRPLHLGKRPLKNGGLHRARVDGDVRRSGGGVQPQRRPAAVRRRDVRAGGPVSPSLRGGNDIDRNRIQPGRGERTFHQGTFGCVLRDAVEALPLASAAPLEVRARRRYASGRRLDERHEASANGPLATLAQLDVGKIARDRVRDRDGPRSEVRERLSVRRHAVKHDADPGAEDLRGGVARRHGFSALLPRHRIPASCGRVTGSTFLTRPGSFSWSSIVRLFGRYSEKRGSTFAVTARMSLADKRSTLSRQESVTIQTWPSG